jgi:hypothetical protein
MGNYSCFVVFTDKKKPYFERGEVQNYADEKHSNVLFRNGQILKIPEDRIFDKMSEALEECKNLDSEQKHSKALAKLADSDPYGDY